MSTDFMTKNRLVLAKVETTTGVDSVPVPATDAVLVEEPRANPNMELETTEEVTGSLDSEQSIVGGGFMERTQRFFAKGSGTAGTAPEYDPYFKAAAMAATILASPQADTAQAGAAGTITLDATATANNLTGFVIEITSGTGVGQRRVIKGYNGTTKVASVYPNWDTNPDNTSEYSVSAGVMYAPASTALKTITDYLYKKNSGSGDAILEKLTGAAANLSFAVQTRQTGKFTATLRGMLVEPVSVANPTGAVFDPVRPRPLRDADAVLGGQRVCFRNFTLDWGNEVTQPDCAAQEFGYDPAVITGRRASGRINPRTVTLAERDAFDLLTKGTTQPLWLDWGEESGNRISMFLPAIALTGKEDDDLEGVSADGLPFQPVGIDNWIYILVY